MQASPLFIHTASLEGRLGRQAAGTIALVLVSCTAVLVWRRLAGALEAPLGIAGLAAAGIGLALVSAAARVPGQRSEQRPDKGLLFARVSIPSIAKLAAGLALWLPGTAAAGLALFWSALAAEEIWAWQRPGFIRAAAQGLSLRFRRWRGGLTAAGAAGGPEAHAPAAETAAEASSGLARTSAATASEEPAVSMPATALTADISETRGEGEQVTQQLTRVLSREGVERVHGLLAAKLAAGQRGTSLHLAFCPPFAQTPQIEYRQTKGKAARIKLTQALPYGARLDIRLAAPEEEETTVLVEISASSSRPAD